MTRKTKTSPLFYVLALVTLALSSWGLFRLFHDFAEMPPLLALLAVGGLDIVAVLCGKHALTVAADGDSSAPWNAALIGFTALAAYAQFQHAVLAGDPLVIGVTMAAFPVATVLLFEGQLRRAYRLNGRAAGRLDQPRATFDLMTWLLYRRLAMEATKLAVLDRGLDAATALMLAERKLELEAAAERQPTRRRMRRTYAALTQGGALQELEPAPDKPADTEPDKDERPDDEVPNVRARGDIAAAVKAAYAELGDNLPDVLAAVRTTIPGAKEDTVRVTLRRLARSAG